MTIERGVLMDVLSLDMGGVVYSFTEEKGVSVGRDFTPEDGTRNDELFERSTRELCKKLYGQVGLDILEAHPPFQFDLERRIVDDILEGKDAPMGIKLNMDAAEMIRYIAELNCLEDKHGSYKDLGRRIKPIIVSSSKATTSQMILRKCLDEFRKIENQTSHRRYYIEIYYRGLGTDIPIYDMSDFGSKKNPEAWRTVFRKAVAGRYIGSVWNIEGAINTIIEDNPEKLEAALEGAKKKGDRAQGYRSVNEYMRDLKR